jgi:hypothetical protein
MTEGPFAESKGTQDDVFDIFNQEFSQ